jgi:cell division initiation protein
VQLSKIDILNKPFSRSFRGYTPAEVDAFLSEVGEELARLTEEKQKLEAKASVLEQALTEHRGREATLRDTLVTTQKMVEDVKSQARKEAELIVREAEGRARALLDEATARLAEQEERIAELARKRVRYEIHLRGVMQAHLHMLDSDAEGFAAGENFTLAPEEGGGE